MAARSKAWVCGRGLAGIVGSNPAGGMDVRVVCCRGISEIRAKSTQYIKRDRKKEK